MILTNFAISSTDTLPNIFVKISAMLDSLPKYIYLRDVTLDIQQIRKAKILNNVEVVDMFSIIKSGNEDVNKFTKNLKVIIDLFPNLDKVNDILKPWLYYNLRGIDSEDFSLILFSIVNTINRGLNTKYDIEFVNFPESSKIFIRDINGKIQENKRLADILISSEVRIEGKPYTPFSLEKIKYSFEIGQRSDITLNEVFNSIVLNSTIPFANMGGYYKVLKDFIPDQEWLLLSDPNIIVLKLIKSEKEYEDVRLKVDSGVFKIILEADVEKASKESVIQTVLNVIKKANPVITNEVPISVKGVFYIPDQDLDKYVFAHLVMNDPSFAVLIIDEVGKATKEKNSIYSYYNTGEYMMSTVITPKIMDRFDPTMKGQSPALFPEGSKYLRVRATMRGEKDAKEMQDNFSKLVSLYNIRYNDVVTLYKKYIPSFPEEVKAKKQVKAIKKKAGESRRCQHFPIIIDKTDIPNYSDYMTFPLDEEGQIYTCETEKLGKFRYVGLQYRKDVGEFSPCCFEVNQKTKLKSNYNKYLEFIKTGKKDSLEKVKQQRIITTKKYVDNGNFGDVYYDNVSRFFQLCDSSVKYFRLGVHRSKMSFLNCIMEVARESGDLAITISDVRSKLNEMANNPSLVSLCRQSLPDKTPEEIKNMLLSDDTYIDPKLFVSMMEFEFNVKIFIFSEKGMEVPIHLKNYLRYENSYNKVVTVIEHMGSESQNAKYPQCELIVYVKGTESTYYYQPSDMVSVKAESIFSEMIGSYILGERVDRYVLDLFGVVGQSIDAYGKASSFIIKYPKGNFIVYTSIPMPPASIPENVDLTYIPTYYEVQDLYGNFKFITRDNITSNCVSITLENKYYIPIVRTRMPSNFKREYDDIVIPQNENSALQTYNMYKKLARYITEYMFYMFSKYINDNSLPMDVKSIEDFVTSSVTVEEGVNYGSISKKFTTGTIVRGGKLIVPTNEILRRLVYSLRLEMSRNPDMLMSYHTRKNIEAYILDISDFSYVPNQVILYGAETVLKYIYELEHSHVLNYNIGFMGNRPFFYRNRNIENGKTFLAQAVDSIEEARSTVYNWEKYRMNTPYGTHNTKIKIYKYDSESSVQMIRKGKGYVLGYKIKGKPLFTVLMEMNKNEVEKEEEKEKEVENMFLEDLLDAYIRANVVFPPQLYVYNMTNEEAVNWLRSEISELAANSARDAKRHTVTKTDILNVLNTDDELNKIFELVGEKVKLDVGFKPRYIDIS